MAKLAQFQAQSGLQFQVQSGTKAQLAGIGPRRVIHAVMDREEVASRKWRALMIN